jgi:hypothetical protein
MTLASTTEVLARKAGGDDIDTDAVSLKALGCELAHVVIAGHLGPMLRQHAPAEGFDLAEGDCLETARPLQPERKAADA